MTDNVPAVSPELPSPVWRATLAALRRLPQGAMSRSFGKLMDTPIPVRLRKIVIGSFARALDIDPSQAEHSIEHYGSINEFFVRKLKPGARNWPSSPATAGSPVEAILGQFGEISTGTLLQAKGRWYTAAMLLDDKDEASRFERGSYITLYLSPRHYHRIHTPLAGTIPKARHIPGQLLPVNAPSVAHVDNLFAINERLVCYLDCSIGRIAIVAVGAYNVGRISAAFDPQWTGTWITNRKGARPDTKMYDPSIEVSAGDEIMAFHLGSTVVMLFEASRIRLSEILRPGEEVLLGQAITQSR